MKTPTSLFSNPTKKPKYSVEIHNPGGALTVSDPKVMRGWLTVMDMYAVLGGAASHFGGPSALIEILSVMHAMIFQKAEKAGKQWHELFHFVNDAGHCENAFYVVKANYEVAGLDFEQLKRFRAIGSPLTGHGEVHCFPEGVLMSNGPLGSALPQAQGLSMADRHLGLNRMTVTIVSDGASMEGEAKESFAAIPGLAKRGLMNPFMMIISDNNTKLSGRVDQESFSMEPTFRSLENLGWTVVKLDNPHDMKACLDCFEKCFQMLKENPNQPIAIQAKTIKGYGTKKTADSASGGHGFPLKKVEEMKAFLEEIFQGNSLTPEILGSLEELKSVEAGHHHKEMGEKIQIGISKAMIRAKKDGFPVVSITSDLPGSTGVAGFRKEFPKESFDVGVAEANMVSTAAGFSKMGFIPVVDTFAQFGVTKGALPLTMANLSQAPIIAVYSHTGFQDAADGASHQAMSYLAMTCSIPHTKVFTLSCSEEAENLFYQAIKEFSDKKASGQMPDSMIFFLGRENFPKNYLQESASFHLGQSQIISDSSHLHPESVCIYATGSLIPNALKAADLMATHSIGTIVVHPSSMKPFDDETLKSVLEKTKGRVVTVDDHQTIGGLGSLLAFECTKLKIQANIKCLGVENEFGRSAYTAEELYRMHHLDADSIEKACLAVIE